MDIDKMEPGEYYITQISPCSDELYAYYKDDNICQRILYFGIVLEKQELAMGGSFSSEAKALVLVDGCVLWPADSGGDFIGIYKHDDPFIENVEKII